MALHACGKALPAGALRGYVQSAISHQIAALESLTGKRLIDRSAALPIALTAAGAILWACRCRDRASAWRRPRLAALDELGKRSA
jgi:DNA-binding transcriptional LysR family regulator